MTTSYSNTAGNLDKKIILSFPYDPERPDTNEQFLVKAPGEAMFYNADLGQVAFSLSARPSHYEDTISDIVRQKKMGGADLGVDANTVLSNPALSNTTYVSAGTTVGGRDDAKDGRDSTDLTVANEFELDANQITHTFSSLTAVSPLPGMPKRTINDARSSAQLNALNIDLGMMREVISVVGIIVDRKDHPSSSSGHHLRRQHLLDMVRTQYAYFHQVENLKDTTWMNINRFPALTIGPIRRTDYGGQTHLDEGYEGEEPSDDVRGTEHTGPSNSDQISRATSNGTYVKSSWTPTPSYKGRNRYRGVITRCSVTNEGGRPDVWSYTFQFTVIKNEMQMRMVGR